MRTISTNNSGRTMYNAQSRNAASRGWVGARELAASLQVSDERKAEREAAERNLGKSTRLRKYLDGAEDARVYTAADREELRGAREAYNDQKRARIEAWRKRQTTTRLGSDILVNCRLSIISKLVETDREMVRPDTGEICTATAKVLRRFLVVSCPFGKNGDITTFKYPITGIAKYQGFLKTLNGCVYDTTKVAEGGKAFMKVDPRYIFLDTDENGRKWAEVRDPQFTIEDTEEDE